jgi:beta-lactam-binding protein with PASTA domain
VTVPGGLIGSNVDAAAGVLRGAGLVPASNRVASEEEEGTVIDAEPDEGTEVPEGSTVTLTVSEGLPEESPSPDEGDEGDDGGGGEGAAPGKGNDKGKGGQGKNGKGKDKGD